MFWRLQSYITIDFFLSNNVKFFLKSLKTVSKLLVLSQKLTNIIFIAATNYHGEFLIGWGKICSVYVKKICDIEVVSVLGIGFT